MINKEYTKITIKSDDLACIKEMSEDLGMESIDFISLLVSDAAKTILIPTLPSLCQIIISKRLSQQNLHKEVRYLDSSKITDSIL